MTNRILAFVSSAILPFVLLLTIAAPSNGEPVVFEIGTLELDDTALNGGQSIVGGNVYTFISSGTVPFGVLFTITTTSTGPNGVLPTDQTGGLGISGGRAGSGIDNNSNNANGSNPNGDYSEELTFTISSISGGTVEFSSFDTAFGNENNGDEYMSVNGGAAIKVTSGTDDLVSGTTLSVAAVSLNVQNFDNRFVVDQIVLDITAVPEPTSAILLGIPLLGMITTRRRS